MDQVGITANLLRRLQTTLASCGPFGSDEDLQSAFIDARIALWRKSIPSADTRIKRVNKLIDCLLNQYNIFQENGLVLFLHVVGENIEIITDCHKLLIELADELEEAIPFQQLWNLPDAELSILSANLDCDYTALSGQDRKEKIFMLIKQVKRQGQMADLRTAARTASLGASYPEHVQALHAKIVEEASSDVREAFKKLTGQVQLYLDELSALHNQLDEWKEVHNLLQNLQNDFARCRSFVFFLDNPQQTTNNKQRDKWLYEIEVEWRPCQRTLRILEGLATGLRVIGLPYDEKAQTGPDWYIAIRQAALEINKELRDRDIQKVTNGLSAFADAVDTHLYLADKNLRDVVKSINRLPRPSVA